MKSFSLKFPEIEPFIDALAVWMLLLCVQLLGSKEVIGQFSGTNILTFKVALELFAIILMMIISHKSSLIADIIDITLYILLFKIIVLEAYLINGELYDLIYGDISIVLNLANFTLILIRMIWASLPATAKIHWPVLGAYGLTKDSIIRNKDRISKLAVFAAIIISFEISIILNHWMPTWPYVIPAIFGIFFVLRYNNLVRNSTFDAINTLADRAKNIEELRIVIDRAAAAIDALSDQQNGIGNPEDPGPKKPQLTRVK